MGSKVKQKKTIDELLEKALIPVDDQPYEIPENWAWVKLESVLKELKNGTTIKQNKDGIGEKVTRIESVQNNNIDQNRLGYIIEKTKLKRNDYYEAGDIVLSHINSIEHVGKTTLIDNKHLPLVHGMNLLRLRLYKEEILPRYAQYYMRTFSFRNDIWNRINRAVNQVSLNQKNLNQVYFPVPPKNEQKRISDKVERLLNKIDEAKQLIDEARQTFELRREAILDKAFRGELTKKWRKNNFNTKINENSKENDFNHFVKIPGTWKWVKLGDVIQVNPPKKKLHDIPDNQICSFLPMTEISDVTGTITNFQSREYSRVKKGYTFFLEGDILFAKITPCMENGKSAIVKRTLNGFGFGSTEFHVLRSNDLINERLIYHLVRSKRFRLKAKEEMTGAVGQQRVPKSFIEEYWFPLPPKLEQNEIVKILDATLWSDEEVRNLLKMENRIESLKNSTLSKAFRGELGTNDPTEESAIELLKEVLQEQLI